MIGLVKINTRKSWVLSVEIGYIKVLKIDCSSTVCVIKLKYNGKQYGK